MFPLWTLHVYVAIFQQHLHMEYLSLRWYDIPKLVVLSGFPWYRVAANKEATESRIPFGKVEVITSNILWSPLWLGWPLWNICVINDHGYVPLVVNTSRFFPHSRLITGLVTRLTLVEQDLLTLQEHLYSPWSLVGFVFLDLLFYMYVLSIVVCPCVLFLLIIVLSVRLRYTVSDCPFGIFKLFCHISKY